VVLLEPLPEIGRPGEERNLHASRDCALTADKQFAMYLDNHHGDGRLALWCKAAPGAQEELVGSDPAHVFVPPYVGKSGWVGIHLDKGLGWGVIEGLLFEGYLAVAPKRLVRAHKAP